MPLFGVERIVIIMANTDFSTKDNTSPPETPHHKYDGLFQCYSQTDTTKTSKGTVTFSSPPSTYPKRDRTFFPNLSKESPTTPRLSEPKFLFANSTALTSPQTSSSHRSSLSFFSISRDNFFQTSLSNPFITRDCWAVIQCFTKQNEVFPIWL